MASLKKKKIEWSIFAKYYKPAQSKEQITEIKPTGGIGLFKKKKRKRRKK